MSQKQKIEKRIYMIIAVVSGILFFIVLYGYRKSIDGDIIGNLIISNLGAQTGSIFPENVFYSTGLPNIGSTLIRQIFFRLGLSFYNTYLVSRFVEIIFYSAALYWFLKLINLEDKMFVIWTVLLMPTTTFFRMIFIGGYYLWSLTSALLLLCLYKCYIQERKNSLIIIIACFSFYKGVLGIKAFMWVFAPLCLGLFVIGHCKKQKSNFILCFSSAIPALAGMIVNEKILLKKYGILSRSTLQFASLDEIDGRFSKAIVELLKAFGWQDGAELISFAGIANIIVFICLLFMLSLFYLGIKKINQIDEFDGLIFLYSFFAFVIIFFILVFTKSDLSADYMAPSCLAVILSCCIFYSKYDGIEFKKKLYPVILVMFLFFYLFSWKQMHMFFVFEQVQVAQENKAVLEILKSRDLKYGYGTFWNSQLIAASSNLEIESANISITQDGFYYFKWLSPKKYYDKSYYDGKVFVLLTESEKEGFDDVIKNISGENDISEVVFDDGYYVIYEMENSDMINHIIG